MPLRLASLDDKEDDPQQTQQEPALYLFNAKTRQKEPFRVANPAKGVSRYTCGPTVYDHAHVGNFRAFLSYDLLKRVLHYFGYRVTHVCNLTDVDDKVIARATALGTSVPELTERYTQFFLDDLMALNIIPATEYPKATEHIDAMMDMIRIVRDKDLAYETYDGSWPFVIVGSTMALSISETRKCPNRWEIA